MKVGVVGASGAVGKVLLEILRQRKFPVTELRGFASQRSVNKKYRFNNKTHSYLSLTDKAFERLDLVFFDASDAVSKQWVPLALKSGAWVIDNSSVFRMQAPLVVPEINGFEVDKLKNNKKLKKLIAGPNCSTVQLVQCLFPLHKKWKLKRVVVSTYQSVSGAGSKAMHTLMQEIKDSLKSSRGIHSSIKRGKNSPFFHPIAFNCLPQVGWFSLEPSKIGWTSEELKIIEETKKILSISNLKMAVTAVRVPTWVGHCESVAVELEENFSSLQEIRRTFDAHSGVKVIDDPKKSLYPLPICGENLIKDVEAAAGSDVVWVGRIRKDPSVKSGVLFWNSSDNLRKGAALNAVQIAERIFST